MTRRGWASVAGLVLLAGCLPVVPPLAPTASSTPAALARYYDQRIDWASCGGFDCASVEVPLDYARPDGATLRLAVKRVRATRQPRAGTLFVNPGGPGGSGVELVTYFDRSGLERLDVVGWDPRGVGGSSPVRCLDGADADAYLDLDASPDTPAERQALRDGARGFAQSCLARTGADLLARISTVDTARDLDVLRAAVGDATLTYLGYSYGTAIGATYAELFPDRAGRLVLDAPIDVTESRAVAQTVGFDRALGNFAAWCAGESSCGLGGSADAVVAGLRADLDRLDATPLKVRGRRLTQSLATAGLAAYLYAGKDAWPLLARAVRSLRQGDGSALLAMADEINSRDASGRYGGLFSAFPAIGCADAARVTHDEADRDWAADIAQAPFFASYLGPDYVCVDWSVPPTRLASVRGRGAPPILVVGATGDPATPYEWAVATSKALESAVLLTFDGEGHGTYGGKSACADAAVQAYLLDGTLPAPGTRCT